MPERLTETATYSLQQPRPCPRCGSARIHRSRHRTPLERLLSFTGAWIRRCHDCRFRFLRLLGMTVPLNEAGIPARKRFIR